MTEFAYDSIGRLASVAVTERNNVLLSDPDTTEYNYDLAGSLQSTEYENGVIHSYVYDSLGRLDDLYHWVDGDGDGVRAADETLASFDYSVRPDGKRLGVTEKFWAGVKAARFGNQLLLQTCGNLVLKPLDDRLKFVNLLAG